MKNMKDLLNLGLINIDKSAGPTSYSVSEFVRRQLGLKKTSHMGTLDPKVSGVLPITLGRACKLAGYFIRHDKSYVGILETHRGCDLGELQGLIDENFVGKILQTPPHRSAVKREERERTVHFWRLIEASDDGKSFLFECRVEGGTYVRKLCSDLGEMIGGAHMGELRRISAGIFSEAQNVSLKNAKSKISLKNASLKNGCALRGAAPDLGKLVKLDEFEAAVLAWKDGDDVRLRGMVVPAEDAIRKVLPVVEVDKSAVKSLYIGRPLFASNIVTQGNGQWAMGNGGSGLREGDVFALFCGAPKGHDSGEPDVFIGIYRRTSEEIIFARSEFVFN